MATHCSILEWRTPWTEEPHRLQGCTESDMTDTAACAPWKVEWYSTTADIQGRACLFTSLKALNLKVHMQKTCCIVSQRLYFPGTLFFGKAALPYGQIARIHASFFFFPSRLFQEFLFCAALSKCKPQNIHPTALTPACGWACFRSERPCCC